MSMHSYAMFGYGLFLPAKDAMMFARAYLKDSDAEDFDDDTPFDCYDFWYDMDAAIITDDTYDGVCMKPLTSDSAINDCDSYDGVFLFARKQGDIFKTKNDENVYDSPDAMAREFSQEYDALPDDFDVKAHLCMVSGAYVG